MFFRSALLTNILFASVAIVVHSSILKSHLAHRRTSGLSGPLKLIGKPGSDSVSDATYSNAAGALWEEAEGTFTYASGIFTVPPLSGSSGSVALAWVGIDGATCQSAALGAGVQLGIDSNGNPSYQAWYQWYPEDLQFIAGFGISPGDGILATVVVFNPTFARVILQNLNTDQTASEYLTSSYPLCQQNAEWIVSQNDDTPLVDFGTVTFTNAVVDGAGGTYTPSGAAIVNVEENNEVFTSVSTDGDTVTIQYV